MHDVCKKRKGASDVGVFITPHARKHVRRVQGCTGPVCLVLAAFFLFTGCLSQSEKTEERGRPLPTFPYVAGASSYFYATDSDMIFPLAARYGLANPALVKSIASLAVSVTERGLVVFVRTKKNVDISTFSKRVRLMKQVKAIALDEGQVNWRIENGDRAYGVNIAYADALMFSEGVDGFIDADVQFVNALPKALAMLQVRDDYAFWLWASMEVFKNTFVEQKLRNGHGAIAIPTYNVNEDVSTDFAFPYNGVRSDFATLKLMLPFLFKSLGADILSSLPDISFTNDIVVIRGVNLSVSTVRSLAQTITGEKTIISP